MESGKQYTVTPENIFLRSCNYHKILDNLTEMRNEINVYFTKTVNNLRKLN